TFIEPTDLAEMGGITVEEADAMILFAEAAAERIENEKPEDKAPDEEAAAGRTVAGLLEEPSAAPVNGVAEAATETPAEETSAAAETPTEEAPPATEEAPSETPTSAEAPANESP